MAMVDSSFADNGVIDKRILREEYRGYDLVARFWEYGYLGKIWKNRRSVEEVDATDDQSLDDLLQTLRSMVDEFVSEKSRARKNRPPSQTELVEAFRTLADQFTPLEKLMLKTHADVEGGEVAMSDLQRALNLTSADSVFEIYGRIGQKLNDEVGYQPKASRTANPHLKYIVEVMGKGASQTLKMPEPVQLLVIGQAW